MPDIGDVMALYLGSGGADRKGRNTRNYLPSRRHEQTRRSTPAGAT